MRFEDGAADRVDARGARPIFARVLRRLPRWDFEPLMLHAVGELNCEDIVVAMGAAEGLGGRLAQALVAHLKHRG